MKNNLGETIVRQAICIKHAKMVKVLLDYGADVSPSANPGALFLHDISCVPTVKDQIWAPMVDTLVRAGWNVNAVRPDDQFTPLMEACRSSCPAIAQKLIDNGANVNYVEKQNLMRPIHIVAMYCLPDCHADSTALLEMLAISGAKVHAKNRDGKTTLHLAPICGYPTMRMLLLLGPHVDATDNAGRLPLHEAVKKRDRGAIEALLQFGAEVNDETVLRELNELEILRGENAGMVIESRIADYLTKHWLKLKAANLPVIDGFADFIKKNYHHEFYVVCLKEVETLKTHRLNDRTTLYDLLHMNVYFKYVFMKRRLLLELSKFANVQLLRTTFPKYHSLILACYSKAFVRYRLIKTAQRAWDNLTGIRLPDCVERILAYLENDDLRLMTEEEEEVYSVYSLKRPSQSMLDEPAKKRRLS